jgi:hypothetical protein
MYLRAVDKTLLVVEAVLALLHNSLALAVTVTLCGSLVLDAKVCARCAGLHAGHGREQSEQGKVELHCGGCSLSADWFNVVKSLTINYSGREVLDAKTSFEGDLRCYLYRTLLQVRFEWRLGRV